MLTNIQPIDGVEKIEVLRNIDNRGFFSEVIRKSDKFFSEGFGQLSHTLSYTGVIKAWHIHREQTDWWYVIGGVIKVALYDTRSASSTYRSLQEFLMGDGQVPIVVCIPPGVAHGYHVLQGPTNLIYATSKEYDGTDEGRIAHDDPEIGYDWTAPPTIR